MQAQVTLAVLLATPHLSGACRRPGLPPLPSSSGRSTNQGQACRGTAHSMCSGALNLDGRLSGSDASCYEYHGLKDMDRRDMDRRTVGREWLGDKERRAVGRQRQEWWTHPLRRPSDTQGMQRGRLLRTWKLSGAPWTTLLGAANSGCFSCDSLGLLRCSLGEKKRSDNK